MTVLCNVLIVEISNSKIQQDIQQEREIEQREVLAVRRISYFILYVRFNNQNPEWLDEQIQEKQND